jgi:hypothetical protein
MTKSNPLLTAPNNEWPFDKLPTQKSVMAVNVQQA